MLNHFKLNNKSKNNFRLFGESGAGYSILELLVVVAIISVLFVVIFSNFPSIKLQLALSRAAYGFEQDLRRAQEMSLSLAEYKDSFGVPQPVAGFGGYINLSNDKQYIIYADSMPGDKNYGAGTDYIVNTVSLEAGIIIKELNGVAGSDVIINFTPPNPTTTIGSLPGVTSMEVVFAIESDPAKIKTVSINTTGLIEIE